MDQSTGIKWWFFYFKFNSKWQGKQKNYKIFKLKFLNAICPAHSFAWSEKLKINEI